MIIKWTQSKKAKNKRKVKKFIEKLEAIPNEVRKEILYQYLLKCKYKYWGVFVEWREYLK